MVEFWRAGRPVVSVPPDLEQVESDGWDGQRAMDSQSLSADPYAVLAAAAVMTSRLGLGTGVTNTYTRHPAVTASAIMSIQVLSQGRATLGIGRGDSALAHLGLAPASVDEFEQHLQLLQRYLNGAAVGFEPIEAPVREVEALNLRRAPAAARLEWVPTDYPKVPLDVAASGPKVIAAAARHADQITFSVGADPRRVEWAIEIARRARRDADLDPAGPSLGIWVNLIVHPDRDVARSLVADSVATVARFSVLHGTVQGPVSPEARPVYEAVHRGYDMTRHSRTKRVPQGAMTKEFIDSFAIVGDSEHCCARLQELVDLGIERFIVIDAPHHADAATAGLTRRLFSEDVMPEFR